MELASAACADAADVVTWIAIGGGAEADDAGVVVGAVVGGPACVGIGESATADNVGTGRFSGRKVASSYGRGK